MFSSYLDSFYFHVWDVIFQKDLFQDTFFLWVWVLIASRLRMYLKLVCNVRSASKSNWIADILLKVLAVGSLVGWRCLMYGSIPPPVILLLSGSPFASCLRSIGLYTELISKPHANLLLMGFFSVVYFFRPFVLVYFVVPCFSRRAML